MILNVDLISQESTQTCDINITHAVIGGWTGRDQAALQAHIDELGELGIAPPAQTPMFYGFSASHLTTRSEIEVIGDGSSGEVEYAMIMHEGKIWVTVGSDHTDRVFEKYGIQLAKQLCDKPIGRSFWAMDEIYDHWDQIELRAHIPGTAGPVLYQDGTLAQLMDPKELIAKYAQIGGKMTDGTLMFGGTGSAIGGVRWAPEFHMELRDPVLGRSIKHNYKATVLPIRG